MTVSSVVFGNDSRVNDIAARSAENSAGFTHFTCRYTYTLAVVKQYGDWKSGPYFDYSSSHGSNPETWTAPASPCSELVWVRGGPRERLEERLADPGAGESVKKGGKRWTCGRSSDELFDGEVGVKIDLIMNGGGLWEGPRRARAVRTPFDYVGATGGDRSLNFANLAARSARRDGIVVSMEDETDADGVRLSRIRFTDDSSDGGIFVEYWFSPDEGGVPVRIRTVASGKQPLESNVFITDRRKIDGQGWFPYRSVSVREGKAGKAGLAVVEIIEVNELDLSAPRDEDFQFILPKMCALHLGEQWKSQFVNDVERPVDLNEVKELIAIAKAVGAGEPRGKFLKDPGALMGQTPVGQTPTGAKKPFITDGWLWIMNFGCLLGCAILYAVRRQRRSTKR